jgi:hypothetical protein
LRLTTFPIRTVDGKLLISLEWPDPTLAHQPASSAT